MMKKGGGGRFGRSGGGGGFLADLSIFEATRCPVCECECECEAGMRADEVARGEEGDFDGGVLRGVGRDVVVVGGRRGLGGLDERVGIVDEQGVEEEEGGDEKLGEISAGECEDVSVGEGLMGVGG